MRCRVRIFGCPQVLVSKDPPIPVSINLVLIHRNVDTKLRCGVRNLVQLEVLQEQEVMAVSKRDRLRTHADYPSVILGASAGYRREANEAMLRHDRSAQQVVNKFADGLERVWCAGEIAVC